MNSDPTRTTRPYVLLVLAPRRLDLLAPHDFETRTWVRRQVRTKLLYRPSPIIISGLETAFLDDETSELDAKVIVFSDDGSRWVNGRRHPADAMAHLSRPAHWPLWHQRVDAMVRSARAARDIGHEVFALILRPYPGPDDDVPFLELAIGAAVELSDGVAAWRTLARTDELT